MRFKIDWASLIVGSKFTVFALFYFVFEGNFPSTSPRGAYIWRGDLTEGFLHYRFGGLIFGGAYTWRGLFSEFYGILFCLFHLPLSGELIFRALQQILLEARIESGKTELSQALKRIALEKGFAISDNQGGGNCMFFALSEQLDFIKGIQMSHDELRRTVVQHLRENPRLVSILLPY